MKSVLNSVLTAAIGSALAGANGALAFQYPDCVNGPLANTTACDVKASPADRAAAVVKAMNITEKLNNLVNTSPGAPRVGLPAYEWWSEALHGLAGSPGVKWNYGATNFSSATSFASPITLGASFDDELVHAVADVISTEARAFSNAGRAGLDFWTPNINPYKDPRWGRGAETPGEDALHIKKYVKALLAGLEGTHATTRKVIATCKHYAAYDLERWNGTLRYNFNAVVSLQDLSEYYLPPFQQCARDSNVGSFMCSYNAVNGTPACASTYLMGDILRGHWGWTGDDNYVTSDCGAIENFMPWDHNITQTFPQAAAVAHIKGTDTVCQGNEQWTDSVVAAYNQSLLPETVIDRALQRLYHGIIRAGYLDPPSMDPYRPISWSDVNTPPAQALALRSATEGIVLLKNDGTLPLTNLVPASTSGGKTAASNKTVALIGFWASATTQLLGPYHGIPPYYHDPVYAAKQLGLSYATATGPLAQNTSVNDTWTSSALDAAAKADVIVYFGGNDQSIASEDRDRMSVAWPSAQLALINKLATVGKPLVVVQLGDQVDDGLLLSNQNVSAILWTGYGGQDAGTAALDVITGRASPAGRLPVTQYPANYTDAVPMTDMALRPSTGANPGRTYRWYPTPILPYGHGLHYTTFNATFDKPIPGSSSSSSSSSPSSLGGIPSSISTNTLLSSCPNSIKHMDLCPFATVPIAVTNTGNMTSDFVALVFVTAEVGPKPYPLKTLVGYARLAAVRPGSTARAEVVVTLGSLARVDGVGNTVLFPGVYKLLLDVPTRQEVVFEVVGAEAVLDEFPQPK